MTERKTIEELLTPLDALLEHYLATPNWIGGHNDLLVATTTAVAELLRRELEWEQTVDILGKAARDEENEP